MKELLLGNEAVARGIYEAGERSFPATRARRVRKLQKPPQSMMRFTANGRRMKRLPRRLPRALLLGARVLSVL